MNPPDWLTDPDAMRIYSATVAELTRRKRVFDPERVAAYSHCMAEAVRWQGCGGVRWIGYAGQKAERWIKQAHRAGQNGATALFLRCADYAINGYLRPAKQVDFLELLAYDIFDELDSTGELVYHHSGEATCYLLQEWEITR